MSSRKAKQHIYVDMYQNRLLIAWKLFKVTVSGSNNVIQPTKRDLSRFSSAPATDCRKIQAHPPTLARQLETKPISLCDRDSGITLFAEAMLKILKAVPVNEKLDP